ncbi:unnamed protein product [Orchesella dallaii]|uniref:Uncharacterized protein n=1 Tax=Orchesella dallaii TaxID=48710 RepID=A0ABP1QJY2_9HEXA
MGSTGTDVLVNELLCATIHAILEGRTNDEILPSFVTFYEDDEIQIARQVVYKLIDKRFAKRSNAKEKDLNEIIGYLRGADFRGNDIKFAAINLSRVCTVYSGIGDERQLRSEVRELRTKFESLTSDLSTIKQLSSSLEGLAADMKVSNEAIKNLKAPTYLQAAKQSIRKGRQHTEPRRPATPPPSQIIAMNNGQYDRKESSDPEGDFMIVRNRRKTLKPKVAVGGAADSNIKAVERARVGILFLTRCTPDTTIDMIEQHIKQTSINYKLRDVELWNAKYKESYSSFKLCFELGNEKLSNFLREVILPDYWPAGTLIKPFGLKRDLRRTQNTQ